MYLSALSAFSMRMTANADYRKLLAAAAMIAVYFLTGALAAWGVAAILTAVLAVLCATDAFVEDVKPLSARGRARRSAA
jgi:hypothetical protein